MKRIIHETISFEELSKEYNNESITIPKAICLLLAKNNTMTLLHIRVLLYILAHIDKNNIITVSRNDIAEYFDLSHSNISRTMRAIEQEGYIIPHKKASTGHIYKLNPLYWGNV